MINHLPRRVTLNSIKKFTRWKATGLISCALSANVNKEYLYFSSLKKHLLKNHKEYYHEVFNKMTKVDIHAFSKQVDQQSNNNLVEKESPKIMQSKNSSSMLPFARKAKKDAVRKIHKESLRMDSVKSDSSAEKVESQQNVKQNSSSEGSLSYHRSQHNEPISSHQLEPQESSKMPSKTDYQSVLLPQTHIKAFCEKSSLPEMNRALNMDSKKHQVTPHMTPDVEVSKRQEVYSKMSPQFQYHQNRPEVVAPVLNNIYDQMKGNQPLGQLMVQNQLASQINAIQGSSPFADIMLYLKSKILLDLFHNAFKRYLGTVKGQIAQNLRTITESNHGLPQDNPDLGFTRYNAPKCARKNTDAMSRDTIEESEAIRHRLTSDRLQIKDVKSESNPLEETKH